MSIIEKEASQVPVIEGYTNINDLYKMVSESVQNDMAIFEAIYESDVRNLTYVKMLKEADGEEEKEEIKDKAKQNNEKTKEGIFATIKNAIIKFFQKISSILSSMSEKMYKFFITKSAFAKKYEKTFMNSDITKMKPIEHYEETAKEFMDFFQKNTKDIQYDEFIDEIKFTKKNITENIMVKSYNDDKDIERFVLVLSRRGINYNTFKEFEEANREMKKVTSNPFLQIKKNKLWESLNTNFSKPIKKLSKDMNDAAKKMQKYDFKSEIIDDVSDENKEKMTSIMNRCIHKIIEYHNLFFRINLKKLNILEKQDIQLFKALIAADKNNKSPYEGEDEFDKELKKEEPQNASALDLEVDELCEACNECFYGE